MKLTNKQFVANYLSKYPIDEVLAFLLVIKTLLVRHQLHRFVSTHTSAADESLTAVVAMVHLLEKYHKCTIADTMALMRLLRQEGMYTKDFSLVVSEKKTHTTIKKWLSHESSGLSLDVVSSDALGVTLSGDGRAYKRTLDTDLQKLLT